MKRLFIIGNGFDIAHGLPTKYLDFRKFLEKDDFSFFERIFEIYKYSFRRIIHPVTHEVLNLNGNEDEYDLLWKDFEFNMREVNEDLIFDEYEFGVEYETEYDDQIKENIERDILETFYGIYEHLQSKLNEWISSIDITNLTKKSSLINNENYDLYLNFNYTRVLEEVYDIEEEICHIHGEMGETPLIMGHNNKNKINGLKRELDYYRTRNIIISNENELEEGMDEYEEYEKLEETNNEFTERIKCEELLKYYQETYKAPSYYIEENYSFFESISDIEEILIIGHSLNEIDMPYFEYIFSKVNGSVKWKVYYYLEKDKEIFKNKILELGVKEESIEMLSTLEFFKLN